MGKSCGRQSWNAEVSMVYGQKTVLYLKRCDTWLPKHMVKDESTF